MNGQSEQQALEKRFAELSARAERRGVYTFTPFLDLAQQSVLRAMERRLPLPPLWFGGYDGAERQLACFGRPEEVGAPPAPPIVCLQVKAKNERFARALGHRDLLGAVMALGVKRELIGDILPGQGRLSLLSGGDRRISLRPADGGGVCGGDLYALRRPGGGTLPAGAGDSDLRVPAAGRADRRRLGSFPQRERGAFSKAAGVCQRARGAFPRRKRPAGGYRLRPGQRAVSAGGRRRRDAKGPAAGDRRPVLSRYYGEFSTFSTVFSTRKAACCRNDPPYVVSVGSRRHFYGRKL